MRKIYLSFVLFAFFFFSFFSGYAMTLQQPKEKGFACIKNSKKEIRYISPEKAIEKNYVEIEVYTVGGQEVADFACYTDQFRSLKSFSGEICDLSGKRLRAVKRSELRSTQYSESLASDAKIYFWKCRVPSFPFLLKYEYEIEWKKGFMGFPPFMPLTDKNTSLTHAEYNLIIPADVTFNYKCFNVSKTEPKVTKQKDEVIYQWSVDNIPSITSELLSPKLMDQVPLIYFIPVNFVFGGISGKLDTWENFGIWQYELFKEREEIPEDLKQKLREMTASATSDYEKVKIVYDYLAETTRYVSIQLGIGGLQPMPAAQVAATSFGDCKALSNYMRAMLKAIGIDSNYTIVSTDKKRLISDFFVSYESDHVILQVPLAQDTLWLECTNAQLPFGYLHASVAGHDVCVVYPGGAKKEVVKDYPDSLNIDSNNTVIKVSSDGSAKFNVNNVKTLHMYESVMDFNTIEKTKQIDYVRKEVNLTYADVSGLTFKEHKTDHPYIELNYTMTTGLLGNKSNNRLFIPVNMFRNNSRKVTESKRKTPIILYSGYCNKDTIQFEFDDNLEIEAIPVSKKLDYPWGSFSVDVARDGNNLKVIHHLIMKEGEYAAEKYPDLKKFINEMVDCYNSHIVVRKKS